jgi:hypothetical protein
VRGEFSPELRALAERQFGAFTRIQARNRGVSWHTLQRRVDWGVLREETERVLVVNGSPDSFEQRAMIGRLHAGPGSGMSVTSAAAHFGLSGFDLEPIHISRPRTNDRAARVGVVWHHPRLLPKHHLVVVNGLVVTTPARTLADLLLEPDMHEARVERALDSARSAALVNHSQLATMAREWCERGRTGSAFLRDYLERKPVDWTPPASNLARRFIHLVVEAGMPEPRSEVNVGDVAAWLGRVDCLDPELPLVAEIDSKRFHTAPLDEDADHVRDERMTRAGFEVVRFAEDEVWYQPKVVVERWRTARREARRRAC